MNFSVFVSNMSPQHKDASICHHVMGQVEPCEHFKRRYRLLKLWKSLWMWKLLLESNGKSTLNRRGFCCLKIPESH